MYFTGKGYFDGEKDISDGQKTYKKMFPFLVIKEMQVKTKRCHLVTPNKLGDITF